MRHGHSRTIRALGKTLFSLLTGCLLTAASVTADTYPNWQQEVISLVSHNRFAEAGNRMRAACVEENSADVCLILASAHFDGEVRFGIESKQIIEAYRYTKLACDRGSKTGCDAYRAAIDDGELIQLVLFEPGVPNRDAQLKAAIQLGADLTATTLYTATLLQKAINDENTEAVGLLLANGADVNYRVSDEDLTPLMYAVNSGNGEIVQLLLDRGADPSQAMQAPDYLRMGNDRANACDLSRKLGKREMLEMLKCPETGNTR